MHPVNANVTAARNSFFIVFFIPFHIVIRYQIPDRNRQVGRL